MDLAARLRRVDPDEADGVLAPVREAHVDGVAVDHVDDAGAPLVGCGGRTPGDQETGSEEQGRPVVARGERGP